LETVKFQSPGGVQEQWWDSIVSQDPVHGISLILRTGYWFKSGVPNYSP